MSMLLDDVRQAGKGIEATEDPTVLRLVVRGPSSRRTQEVVLRALANALPVANLWLAGQDLDLIEGASLSGSGSEDLPSWIRLADVLKSQEEGVLDRGAWGLFFGEAGELVESPPQQLAFTPPEVKELTSRVGARAAIISWYDDNEWLIVVDSA